MKIKYDYKDIINNINVLDNNNEEEQHSFFIDYFYNTLSSLGESSPDWFQSITKIDNYAFEGCEALTSVTIPFGVTSIGDFAFSGCYNLESVTIPDSVTSIGWSAFSFCHTLTTITIPKNVTKIDDRVFGYCNQLKDVYLYPIIPPTLGGYDAISSYTTTIHVPVGSGNAYKSATNWSNYADIIVEDIIVE